MVYTLQEQVQATTMLTLIVGLGWDVPGQLVGHIWDCPSDPKCAKVWTLWNPFVTVFDSSVGITEVQNPQFPTYKMCWLNNESLSFLPVQSFQYLNGFLTQYEGSLCLKAESNKTSSWLVFIPSMLKTKDSLKCRVWFRFSMINFIKFKCVFQKHIKWYYINYSTNEKENFKTSRSTLWPLYKTHFPFHNICFNLCEFSKWTE